VKFLAGAIQDKASTGQLAEADNIGVH